MISRASCGRRSLSSDMSILRLLLAREKLLRSVCRSGEKKFPRHCAVSAFDAFNNFFYNLNLVSMIKFIGAETAIWRLLWFFIAL
jgi:hypothetical protein